MKTITWLVLSLTLFLSAGLVTPAAAGPAHTSCADSLSNLKIHGNLTVPAGEDCELVGVTVLGNVRVGERASLAVIESRIAGTLTGSDFERVGLRDASVGGHIRLSGGASTELERTTAERDVRLIGQVDTRVLQSQLRDNLVVRGASEVTLICGTTVEGDARFAEHRGGLLIGDDPTAPGYCSANEVWGNLRVHHNQSDTIIANTTVGRNLICVANDPAPILYGNQVGGTARGQCGKNEPVDTTELTGTE